MIKKLIFLICMLCLATSAFAVPNLQLYIPGGTFDDVTETWIAPSAGTFDVWVLAGNISATTSIYDIGLIASLATDADPASGSLTITSYDDASVNVYSGTTAGNFAWGTPSMDSRLLPGHGIFPTWYVDQLVTAQTSTNSADWEPVYDMPEFPSGGSTTGQIFRYSVVSSFDYVHFDAYGFNERDRSTFAPFSHDGEAAVPEPATMLLFGLGLAGAGISRKFRAKK